MLAAEPCQRCHDAVSKMDAAHLASFLPGFRSKLSVHVNVSDLNLRKFLENLDPMEFANIVVTLLVSAQKKRGRS